MEYQLWKAIVAILAALDKPPKPAGCDYSDTEIVKVHYWAVIHDRGMEWACCKQNWPIHLRRFALPSHTTLSRRLRSPSVIDLLQALEYRVLAPKKPGLFWMIDGKPLPIGGCSKDQQAGYGRAANSKAKGYKLHAIVDPEGATAAWRIAPMNKDERVMAERLVRTAPIQGYLVADSNYDSNKLHQACGAREQLQLVARRRYGPGRGTGHRKQSPGRLRSMQLTESPMPAFANQLFKDRAQIERCFGQATSWGGGLVCLPPWVRTHRRVHRWVQAKLVLTGLRRMKELKTYVA